MFCCGLSAVVVFMCGDVLLRVEDDESSRPSRSCCTAVKKKS